ncbi:MAG TPA: MarR family transcriptional regulator [Hellea balneolensis]|uniref:MarR family transcriptional regulator n=1 Tax=Hellea balneolensis TaxID=287478 RepID=A0A7C5LTN0_9PROT|nr:MarR family transcriptional regulator [Hellea balneolensis]
MHVKGQDKLSRSEGLRLWHRVNLGSVLADAPDLTTRQLAILTTVYLEPAPHTVRSLAARLKVTKAVITRALNTLGRHGFVSRGPDPHDKRSVVVHRTASGARYLSDFAERVRYEANALSPAGANHLRAV